MYAFIRIFWQLQQKPPGREWPGGFFFILFDPVAILALLQVPLCTLVLQLPHPAIEAALFYQFRRAALLRHMAVLQYHDVVDSRHGTHSEGDD